MRYHFRCGVSFDYDFKFKNTSLTVQQRCVFSLSNFLTVTIKATNKAIVTTVTIASSKNNMYIKNVQKNI